MPLSGEHGGTLADLYGSLSKVNAQLETSSHPVPLTTSKLSNLHNRGRAAKGCSDPVSTKRQLELEQRSIRVLIDLQSRHGIRPLQICNLPDELLSEIFANVRGAAYVEEASGLGCRLYATKDIKNIRLVCRRFCGASSHLLLTFVRIDVTTMSIARLRGISLHPVFHKTVCGVKIRMSVYSNHLSHRIQNFAAYHIGQLRKEIRRLDGLREWNNKHEKEIKKANLIIDAWTPVAEERPRPAHARDERHARYESLLAAAYDEYNRHMTSQEEIARNGSFVRDVDAAIALMPKVAGLQLCGGSWFDNVRINFGILKSDDILRQSLLLPIPCQEHRLHDNNEQPLSIISALPCAIRKRTPSEASSLYLPFVGVDRYRPQLRKITLSNLSCTQQQLESILGALSILKIHIKLKGIHLLVGSWATVLDKLRQYHQSEWIVDDPAGGECDTLSNEEKRLVFGNPRSRSNDELSLAECYIAGIPGYFNPLRLEEEME